MVTAGNTEASLAGPTGFTGSMGFTGGAGVLVVDDEPMVRDFVARVLRRNGYECRTASDAGEAVAAAMDRSPTVVVTDIRMPGKDGGWLLSELKKRWPEIPVIMLTAVSEAKQAVECLKAGAHDYLVKPIDIDELLISVRRGAEQVHQNQEIRRRHRELEESLNLRTSRLRGALHTIETAYQDALGAIVDARSGMEPKGRHPLPLSWALGEPAGAFAATGPSYEPLGDDQAIELASLRIAGKLIAEGGSHLAVAQAIGRELVDRGRALYVRLWARGNGEPGLEAVVDVGAAMLPGATMAGQALTSRKTRWQEDHGVTSVATPIIVRGVPECALQLGWPGAAHEDLRALTERLALILAASLSRENDARERMRTAEELDIFQKLASASRYSLDLQHVANFLMTSLHRIVDYDVAALLLLEDEPSLTVQARCRMDAEFTRRVRSHIWNTLKLTCGVEAPADLEPTFVEVEHEREKHERLAPQKLRSFVNVPLSVGGAVVGLIHVSSGRDQAFSEGEVLFVHRAAEFLASSVQGVRELLQTVKSRIEQMVEHMTDGVLMLDGRGRVVAINGAARSALGCDSGETPDVARLAKLLEWDPLTLMRSERRSLRRLVCLRGLAYQTQLSPVEDEKRELVGTVLAFRDFEEEKRADEMKTELVNVVSHELRTPLTAIRNALFLLRSPRLGEMSTEQHRFLDLAKRNVEQLIEIINDLLDLSKIEAGKMHLDLEPLAVDRPIGDALLAMDPQAEEKGVLLESDVASGLPQIYGHAASLQRVVVNLVGNAIKFTEKGGRVRVTVSAADGSELGSSAGAVRVTVSDSGVGIPADQLESIFEKFQQVEGREQRKAPGTGLGLSISRELVKAHHGRIWAESEAGQGSRFSFLIPVLSQQDLMTRALEVEIARAHELKSPLALVVARPANPEEAAVKELLTVVRRVVRRSSDRVLWQKDSGDIAILLPHTAMDGASAFEARVVAELQKAGKPAEVEAALALGSAQYPDDATTAEALYGVASERVRETTHV